MILHVSAYVKQISFAPKEERCVGCVCRERDKERQRHGAQKKETKKGRDIREEQDRYVGEKVVLCCMLYVV